MPTGIYKRKPCSEETKKKISESHLGKKHWNWKGGKMVTGEGYLCAYCPFHPLASKNHLKEHRLVLEQKIGRPLNKDEFVHHIDGNKQNNNIDNLEIMTNSEHLKLHWANEEFRKSRSEATKLWWAERRTP